MKKLIPSLRRWEWTIIFSACLSLTSYAGTLCSYGVIMKLVKQKFNTSSLTAGWVGSLAFGFTVGMCPISTALYAKYGGRKLICAGTFGCLTCLSVASYSTNIYLMFLFYSIGFGTSSNFVYNSYINIIGDCFKADVLAFASCTGSFGVSFGTLAMNPVNLFLTMQLGWRNSMRVFAATQFVINLWLLWLLPPICFISSTDPEKQPQDTKKEMYDVVDGAVHEMYEDSKKEPKTDEKGYELESSGGSSNASVASFVSKFSLAIRDVKKALYTRKIIDFHVCSNISFWLWLIGTFCWSVALLFPNIFLIDYQALIGVPKKDRAWAMTVLGVCDLMGRVNAALFGDRLPFSMAYLFTLCSLVGGIVATITPLRKEIDFVYLYVIVVGICVGHLNSMVFAGTMDFFKKQNGFYAWGYVNVMLAGGMVVGPMIAGGLLDATNSYDSAFYVGGGFFFVAAVCMVCIPTCLKKYPLLQPDQRDEAKSMMKKLHKPHRDPVMEVELIAEVSHESELSDE